MKRLKKISILLTLLFLAIAAKAGSNDSLFSAVQQAVSEKIATREQENELRKEQGLEADYIIYVTDEDVQKKLADPSGNVLSLTQKNTRQADVDKIWDFSGNSTLKSLQQQMQKFSTDEGYENYVVICAIYNYFFLDEADDFSNITWDNVGILRSKNITTGSSGISSKGEGAKGGYSNLLKYLIEKFNNDKTLTRSSNKNHIYHFVVTAYVPFIEANENKPQGRLHHFLGVYWSSPNGDPLYDAAWEASYKKHMAELTNNNTASQKGSKEEWLKAYVTEDENMIAAIRSIKEPDLLAIKDADILQQKLEILPEAVFGGFSLELRKHILQVLSGVVIFDKSEKIICGLIEQTPTAQADDILSSLHGTNPHIPQQIPQTDGMYGSNAGAKKDNPKKDWCLLQCITEETGDSKLCIGNDNYQRLIKALIGLSYKSNGFVQKAKKLNDDYLNATDDKIPDRVIFYTYNSFWKKIATSFKNGNLVAVPELDWNISYFKNCELEVQRELFFSYLLPNGEIDKKNLDPFEPIVFENNADLGLLTELNETAVPKDHIVPAIILKYGDDKAWNATAADATMATIDALSMATGYGELKAGITGLRKAWVLFDMVNSGINLGVSTLAYDNKKIQEILGYYNIATGAIALTRMSTGAVKGVKNYYNALKAEHTAMSATSIRSFVRSVTEGGEDLKNLHPEDAKTVTDYLQRLKAEANTRGLSNFEKSVDDALGVMGKANKAGGSWKWLPEGAIAKAEELTLGTGGKISYSSTKFSGLTFENQVKTLTENVQGLTKEQAEFLLNMAKEKNARIVFGGSRVRGNATGISDLDVGFDGVTQNQLYDIANKYNKKFFGSSQSTAPGSITDRFIFTGKSTDNIPEILSPEEFFMRSGNRYYLDKGGAEYIPSGFISVDGVGNVHLGKPLN